MGFGDTNNHLGGRATLDQATGYSLIVYDAGDRAPGTLMPDGTDRDREKVDQAGWFRDWLASASVSEAGTATLWLLGAALVRERPWWYSTEAGAQLHYVSEGFFLNLDAVGQNAVVLDNGTISTSVDFSDDRYSLGGECVGLGRDGYLRHYDGLAPYNTAVATHRYENAGHGTPGADAIVMNSNASAHWNTIVQSHPWSHIVDSFGEAPSPLDPAKNLLGKVLAATLPIDCQQTPSPTDVRPADETLATLPRVTVLHANTPNPFNPTTTIRFDLARDGRVALAIYDVAGRLVRTLVDAPLQRERHELVWNGLDNTGGHVSTGVYFYRLSAPGFTEARRMVLLR